MGSTIGARALKEHTSAVLRRVREDGETIDVTYRGEVVARLVPVRRDQAPPEGGAIWADLDSVAAEIGAHWPPDVSAVDAVRDGRREL